MSTTLLYFKRKNNACYTINIKPELAFISIVNILARKQLISVDSLLLIHKGKAVQNIQELAKLSNKSIVHLVDRQQVKGERICINLRDIHNNQSTKIVDSSCRIGHFVRQQLSKIDQTPHFQIGLFYLGKILNPQKTFAEQLVENNSQLFVINLKDYVKSDKAVSQPQKNNISKQNQDEEIHQNFKINHRIQRKQPEKEVELKSAPIRFQENKSQQIKEEGQKIQEQKQQEYSDILPSDFKQTPSEQLNKHEDNKAKQINTQGQIKGEDNEVANQQTPVLQAAPIQAKQQQTQPQKNNMKQEKYIKKQTLQSKQGEKILQQIMEVSQLPEITYYNFKIRISQVESQDSDDERKNRVEFHEEDHHSIQSSECHKLQPIEQTNQPKVAQILSNQQEAKASQLEIQPSLQMQPLENLGQRDILPGDLIYTGADYQNQTISFIDNLLKQYKGMFE